MAKESTVSLSGYPIIICNTKLNFPRELSANLYGGGIPICCTTVLQGFEPTYIIGLQNHLVLTYVH